MVKQVSEIENPMAQVESQSESLETTWIDASIRLAASLSPFDSTNSAAQAYF